jgi:DNA-binding beta-propeller fold protein YncE
LSFLIRFSATHLIPTLAAAALLAAALLAPGSAAAFEPVASFGSYGEGAGQLSEPAAIAVGPDGTFFIADYGNNRVDAFSPTGEFRYAFGKGVRSGGGDVCDAGSGCKRGAFGFSGGALLQPEGIAVSNSGDVYVAESLGNRVSVFSAAGSFLFAFGKDVNPVGVSDEEREVCSAVCQPGSNEGLPPSPSEEGPRGPAGAIGGPSGVAIGGAGRVFVAERANDRISVFSPLGKFLFAFGLEVDSKTSEAKCSADCKQGNPSPGGGISAPGGVAAMPGGQLAISNSGNHRLDVYSEEGEFVRAIGREVDPAGGGICVVRVECRAGATEGAGAVSEPAGLAVSSTGAITVGDPGFPVEPPAPGPERVTRFNPDGEFLRSFGAGVVDGTAAFQICTALTGCRNGLESTVPGATPHPYGVAEACGGSIFVAESSEGFARIERFGEPGSAAACTLPGQQPPASLVRGRVVPSNFFRFGRVKRNRQSGTATLTVAVPVAGRLQLGGRGIHHIRRTPTGAATVALPVRLVGKPRRQLLATGHRKALAKITFTPTGGTPRTEQRRLTLVKKLKPRTKDRR